MSPFVGLPQHHYRAIAIDPPWAFSAGTKGRPQHYGRMSDREIADMPVGDLAPGRHTEGMEQHERGTLQEAELRIGEVQIELQRLRHHGEEKALAESEQLKPTEQEREADGTGRLLKRREYRPHVWSIRRVVGAMPSLRSSLFEDIVRRRNACPRRST